MIKKNNDVSPLIPEERRSSILQELNEYGVLHIDVTSKRMGISQVTLRRDLASLESEGLCLRKRGGAVKTFASVSTELPYDIKRNQRVEEKKRIGKAASEYIVDGSTIILDSGSTTYALSLFLRTKSRLTVVTNDLQIAVKLANFSNIQTICTGGLVRSNVFSLQGNGVVDFIRGLKVDLTFLGADAIETDLTISNVTVEEVAIKKAMLKSAKKTFLLADSSKFNRSGFMKVCNLSEVDSVITDSALDKTHISLLKEANIIFQLT
ncbi:MAG: DeoR/GlpR family DNA-binding transcription regulator [Anaerolineaceae bacterium]|nr:DeoR/GlpR family DNA-binding transcription regulator [Anaerolineaceae bacterium]